ncbi:MAG: hypothetical protein QM756_01890 [Polyangiaceae bacterium]
MTTCNVLLLVVAMAAVVGIAYGMTRWSLRKYDDLRAMVAESDAAFQRVASALGLRFIAPDGYEHPIVGTIPRFGVAVGTLEGVSVELGVGFDSDGSFARTELSAKLAPGSRTSRAVDANAADERYYLEYEGSRLTLCPVAKKRGSSQFIVYQLETDAALLIELSRELVRIVRNAAG